MLRIERRSEGGFSTEVSVGSPDELARARAQFEAEDHVVVRGFLGDRLGREVLRDIEHARFETKHHGIDAVEACVDLADPAATRLEFIVNDQRVLDAVAAISGQPHLGLCAGRIYRMDPDSEHHDAWHSDLEHGKLVAMGLNLSPRPFAGGELAFRHRSTRRPIRSVRNTGFADAVIFKIAPHLQHRVGAVTGDTPRVVFAGWFKASSYSDMLQGLPAAAAGNSPALSSGPVSPSSGLDREHARAAATRQAGRSLPHRRAPRAP